MKQIVLAFACLALFVVGCSDPVAEKLTPVGDLLATVDKAGLESTIAANPVVLVEFTADW